LYYINEDKLTFNLREWKVALEVVISGELGLSEFIINSRFIDAKFYCGMILMGGEFSFI